MVPAKSRTGVYKTFPNQFQLRLSDEQIKRIERAAKSKSKSVSDFLRDAAMEYVARHEAEVEAKKTKQDEGAKRAFVPQNTVRPRGLGLSPLPATAAPAPVLAPSMPQIIVQVPSATGAAAPDSNVDVLVNYLKAARNTIDSLKREKQVEAMIKAIEPKEERERIAKAVDERVKAESKAKAKSPWNFLAGGR